MNFPRKAELRLAIEGSANANSNGALLAFNDDWITDREARILFSNEAPADARESALLRTLAPGPYTVVVRGKDETVGIALLEVYVLQ